MGGVAGHMSHLYDNPDLKFSQMMDIFKAAANGELKGTEKTDGQNLFVGYNVAEGKAKAARNKSNVKQGGLDATELATKFAGRGTVEQAFNEAFQTFELAAQSLPRKTQREIFGDGINNIIFYNAEIQDPRNANVVNYDTKLLNIHRVGHFAVDLKTGEILDIDVGPSAVKLENSLDQMQRAVANQEFKVQMNAIRQLEGLSDGKHLDYALDRLNRILDDAGVSDNQTVGEYVVARLMPMIKSQVSLPEEKENMLVKKLLGIKGVNIRDIKRDLNPTQVQAIGMLVSNSKAIAQNAIQPLEDIVHDFAVEMIRDLKSAFILDQDPEVKRLQAETDQAIKGIEASGNEEAMEILRKQMQKLKTIENVSTAAEGFVFDYDGYTYKFTGNFAPMNQLLGLFKYGRGNIPAMQMLSEVEGDGIENVVAIYPGRFQPMGKHHAEAFKWLQNQFGEENVYVATSNVVDPPRSPLNFEEKKQAMLAHGIPESQIVQVKNPYKAEEILSSYDPETTAVAFMIGEKDMKGDPRFRVGEKKRGGPTYFQEFESNVKNLRPFSEHGYLVVAPHISLDIAGFGEMCGTTCRAAIADGDQQLFANVMGFFDEDLYNLFKEKFESDTLNEEVQSMPLGIFFGLIEEVLTEIKNPDKGHAGVSLPFIDSPTEPPNYEESEEELFTEEEIEEASGAGAAGGYSLPVGVKPPHKKDKRIEQMDRHQIYEEIKLRGLIREGLKKISTKIKNEKQQEILEENSLRNIIRKLILVEKTSVGDSDPAPHQSTGINFLERLLKQIVPILEDAYKTLTTDSEQRESFRNHILKAVEDTIKPLRVTGQLSASDDSLIEEDEEDLTVKIEDDPDFIDIRSEKEIEDQEKEENGEALTAEDEEESFAIEGENKVGRNAAFDTFKAISKQIVSTYDELSGSPEDQKLFYEYLLTNIKLYFDKFENDMTPVEEPDSPDYDSTQMDQEAESTKVSGETFEQEATMGF